MSRRTLLSWTHLLIFAASLPACNDPTAGAPKAKVADPPAKAAPAQAAPAAAEAHATKTLALDPTRSKVRFVGAKVTASHDGSFSKVEGEATFDGTTPKAVAVTVHVASLEAEPPKLREHLLSDDFFAAERHPTATFRSTAIVPKATGDSTHEITGDLTLRGTTKRITVPARIEIEGSKARGRARFSIDRKDFGIVYPGMKDDLIQDEVLLDLDLVFGPS